MSEKYNILIVEDEVDVARLIINKIDWGKLGYETPRLAENGLEALDLAEKSRPDVVMTDIMMPFMDGLELSRRLRSEYPDIRIIIISGFDEFEYAKEAVHLEAEEYLLKPVDLARMKEVFAHVKEHLDQDLDRRLNVERLETYYEENLPRLRDMFFGALLQDGVEADKIDKYIADYRIDLTGKGFIIAVIHVSSSQNEFDLKLLEFSVGQLARQRIPGRWKSYIFNNLGNTVVLCQVENEEEAKDFTDDMDHFCRLAYAGCHAVISVGIGRCVKNIRDISKSYSGALSALSYRVIYGRQKAINIAETDPDARISLPEAGDDEMRRILKKVKIGDDDSLNRIIVDYIKKETSGATDAQQYYLFVMDTVGQLYRFARNNHLDIREVFGTNDDIYAHIQHLERDEFEVWVCDACDIMRRMIQNKRTDSTRSFINKAIEYIEDHYGDQDLSVTSLCENLGVSAAYFSTMFKKETGKSFVNYLTEYRMERAAEMLIDHDEKTYVVAQQVGYADPNYFSYVFRRYFGISPSKYRSGNNGK